MVGRRRKRPLEDAVGSVNSNEWVIANYAPSPATPAMLSPANTSASEESTKFLGLHPSWTLSMDSNDQAEFFTVPHGGVSPAQSASSYNFLDRHASRAGSTGLPTPALSPPQFAYLSPMMLEKKATSPTPQPPHFLAPAQPSPACPSSQSQQSPDDEEMICIKLLCHLKRSSAAAATSQSLDEHVNLVKKSNAAVRRILKSRNARSDYACVMLLSSIMLRVVELCEAVARHPHRDEQASGSDTDVDAEADAPFLSTFADNFFNESEQAYFHNGDRLPTPPGPDRAMTQHEVLVPTLELVAAIGNMIKRKPLDGFQTLGRHESLLLELEQRLRDSLATLS